MRDHAICDSCLHLKNISELENLEISPDGKEVYFCCNRCGRKTTIGNAIGLGELAFSFGQVVINNGIVDIFNKRFKDPLFRPMHAFPMRLSEETTEVDLFAALEETDFVSNPGCVSKDAVRKEGIHLLKTILKGKTRRLKRVTGINFIPSWISAILLATHTGNITGRLRYPKFGYTITQKIPEYLGKEFILCSDIINEHSHFHPVLPDDEDMHRAIREGSVQGFRETYGAHIFGDVDIEFQRPTNTRTHVKCYVAKVTVRKFPAVILFPEKQRAYIFYK